jgi:hypothetical protein
VIPFSRIARSPPGEACLCSSFPAILRLKLLTSAYAHRAGGAHQGSLVSSSRGGGTLTVGSDGPCAASDRISEKPERFAAGWKTARKIGRNLWRQFRHPSRQSPNSANGGSGREPDFMCESLPMTPLGEAADGVRQFRIGQGAIGTPLTRFRTADGEGAGGFATDLLEQAVDVSLAAAEHAPDLF